MWICANDGFVSIVADRENPDRLLVRARRAADLRNVLKDHPAYHGEIFQDGGADYRWRVFIPRNIIAAIVKNRIEDIDYDNFKNSVRDRELHDLYARFWELHWAYQYADRAVKAIKKVGHRLHHGR